MSEPDPVLVARNLVMHFGARAAGVRAVDDVSLSLYPGETLAVVGESGSGKSTTARIVAKLLQPTSGTVELFGEDVTSTSAERLRAVRRNIQFVFQDPYSSLNPRHTVQEIVSAPLRYQKIPPPAGGYRALVKELMDRVGLDPDHSDRYPAQFSGGQAQRIGIARAMAIGPRIIICDEAVSALDVSVQAQVLRLLRTLQADHAYTYLFITHDLGVVRQLAHRIAVMSRGRIVETADRDTLFRDPQNKYTKNLLAAVPRLTTGSTDRKDE